MKKAAAEFFLGAPGIEALPPPSLPEFALIGRSNVGKSTLVNCLAGQKAIARVSATPGCTRTINFYKFADAFFLVDLPGYGYAKAGKAVRWLLQRAVAEYLAGRPSLRRSFVLVDSRLEPQRIDLEFAAWMAERGLPLSFVFTKSDKAKAAEAQKNREAFLSEIEKIAPSAPPGFFVTSGRTKAGVGELRKTLFELARGG